MSYVSVASARGTGYAASVDKSGGLQTSPAPHVVEQTQVTIGSGGGTVAAARSGRRAIQIQNLDPVNPLHLRLDATTPTTADLRVDPGAIYAPPCSVTYEGIVKGYAAANVAVAVVEWVVPA